MSMVAMMPSGTVAFTTDDASRTILQRSSLHAQQQSIVSAIRSCLWKQLCLKWFKMTRSCICTSDAPPLWTSTRWETLQTLRYSAPMNQQTINQQNWFHDLKTSIFSIFLIATNSVSIKGLAKVGPTMGASICRAISRNWCKSAWPVASVKWNHPPSHRSRPWRGQCRYPKPKQTHSVSPNPRPHRNPGNTNILLQGWKLDCRYYIYMIIYNIYIYIFIFFWFLDTCWRIAFYCCFWEFWSFEVNGMQKNHNATNHPIHAGPHLVGFPDSWNVTHGISSPIQIIVLGWITKCKFCTYLCWVCMLQNHLSMDNMLRSFCGS